MPELATPALNIITRTTQTSLQTVNAIKTTMGTETGLINTTTDFTVFPSTKNILSISKRVNGLPPVRSIGANTHMVKFYSTLKTKITTNKRLNLYLFFAVDQYEQRFNVFNNNYTDDKDSHGIANVRLADRIEFFCVQNLSNEAAYNGGPQLQEMTYKNWSTGYSDADLTAWQHSGYHSQQVNNHVDITQQTDSDEPNLDQFIMTSFPGDESTEPIVLTASEEADILTRLLPRCLLDDE
ncbi:hypothetical protein L596_000428 [Steinernema carpocapsae]|uniref:Uncharacterized protein n=1 Tax=Steinernema carpocapsae TaxID=34508 RepID=A0A4U8UJI1_STECR|nr:hypothetical protein L596_000428 [Steinernema carpocapsae]